ncbi:MerR family transcriptional regulator [Staphylococcus pasteuri]|uniref:MerR family transcriptional regulator n=1 Tax=Staphylococcus pasteuri TaxID=45972 RepID=UPI003261ADD8
MEFQYSLKQIMDITGVTKRTLHYYDEIGLLKVQKNENNYKVYNQNDLVRLQKILLLKNLDMSIKEIYEVIDYNDEQLKSVLENQKVSLTQNINNLENSRIAIEKFINNIPIVEIEELNHVPYKQYQEEAKIKYENLDVYKTYTNKHNDQLLSNKENIERLDQIFEKFNGLALNKVNISEMKDVVYEWKELMNLYTHFDNELLCLIADTYHNDVRFKNYFKKFNNPYLTSFISEAVNYHLSQVQS